MDTEILFFIIKLIFGGITAFLSIIMLSKTRDIASMFLVTGFLLSYAVVVYELFIKLGIFAVSKVNLFGIPVINLLCVLLPSICFILAFIFMILKE